MSEWDRCWLEGRMSYIGTLAYRLGLDAVKTVYWTMGKAA